MERELSPEQRAEIKALIEDLESGKYKQASGTLRITKDKEGNRVIGHCCLGVGGQRLVDKGICFWSNPRELIDDGNRGYEGYSWILAHKDDQTRNTRNYMGSEAYTNYGFGFVSSDSEQLRYAKMNDSGKSFLEIAAQMRVDFGFPPKGWDKVEGGNESM